MIVREFPIKKARGRLQCPPHSDFETAPRMASQAREGWASPLLIRCPDPVSVAAWHSFIAMIEDWFTETHNPNRKFVMYGVFGSEEHPYRVDREFHGVMIYFLDYGDAVHLKLAMCEHCDF